MTFEGLRRRLEHRLCYEMEAFMSVLMCNQPDEACCVIVWDSQLTGFRKAELSKLLQEKKKQSRLYFLVQILFRFAFFSYQNSWHSHKASVFSRELQILVKGDSQRQQQLMLPSVQSTERIPATIRFFVTLLAELSRISRTQLSSVSDIQHRATNELCVTPGPLADDVVNFIPIWQGGHLVI